MVPVSQPSPADAARPRRGGRVVAQHAIALLFFAPLAVFLTWPLAAHLGTHVPGTALDDNALFVWNFWWVRRAFADPAAQVFFTDALFHPQGVDLVLHSYSLLNAATGATLFGSLTVVQALNLTLLVSCMLNGFSAYVLAEYLTRNWRASVVAGAFFAACPLFAVHLFGHFNYYTAWPLVVCVGAWVDAVRGWSWRTVLLAGASLAAVAYADYYYFVYALCVAVMAVCARIGDVDVVPRRDRVTRIDATLIGLALIAMSLSLFISVTGGGIWHLGPLRVSLTTGTNVRALATALVLWWAWRRRTWTMAFGWRGGAMRQMSGLGAAGAVCAVLMAPILAHAWQLWRTGQYVTQSYWWRSAPPGLDLASVVSGNPCNPFWGGVVRTLYDARAMDRFNDPLWLGVVPLVLFLTRREWMTSPLARRWLLLTTGFLIWALGPFLTIAGFNTGLPLPEILLRYVPVVSNARIPSHASVTVCLGVAMLLALAMTRARRLQSELAMFTMLGLVLIDLCAAPFPLTALERPALYDRLKTQPAGAVLDVPVGIRDGFGPVGVFDASILYFQTLHEKPIATGYVARLPPAVRQRYDTSPVMQTLFQLSAGGESPQSLGPLAAKQSLARDWGVRYVVVHERAASTAVRRFIEAMALPVIDRDESRIVYALPWESFTP